MKADAELAVTEIENLNQVVGDVIGIYTKFYRPFFLTKLAFFGGKL